jgi:CheY-like chemotaxis protein
MEVLLSHRPSCIIVEDEPDTRLLLSQILSMRGYSVRSAEDGFAALELIRNAVPDVLLSDLNMPGMSGFELLSVVRRLYPQIHVIATSAAYSGTLVPRGIAADGFHEKGTGLPALFGLMEHADTLVHGSFTSERRPTPLWVQIQRRTPLEKDHVLLTCPDCLRPFRQDIDVINANIREALCSYCGRAVAYAVALASKPHVPPATRVDQPLPLRMNMLAGGNL